MAEVRARLEPLSAADLDAVQAHLDRFTSAIAGIRTAVVASVDGFAVAQSCNLGNSSDRLAAMTSSMLALAKAVSRELLIGDLEVLMMEAADGKVLMLSIPLPVRPLLLMASCSRRCVIGNVLWNARECSRHIHQTLSAA